MFAELFYLRQRNLVNEHSMYFFYYVFFINFYKLKKRNFKQKVADVLNLSK